MRFVCLSDTHLRHEIAIPDGDVLLHAGDFTMRGSVPEVTIERVGCADLLYAVKRVAPKYHIFGHIHEGYGITQAGPTTFVNAAVCDEDYNPIHPPIVFDLA